MPNLIIHFLLSLQEMVPESEHCTLCAFHCISGKEYGMALEHEIFPIFHGIVDLPWIPPSGNDIRYSKFTKFLQIVRGIETCICNHNNVWCTRFLHWTFQEHHAVYRHWKCTEIYGMLLPGGNRNSSCTCRKYSSMLVYPSVADMMLSPMLSTWVSFMSSEKKDVL